MKKLLFMLATTTLSPLHGMNYTKMPKAPYSEKLFVQTVESGSPEEIDFYIQEHNITYFDVLKVCATNNSIQALPYVLPKVLQPKPIRRTELVEYFKKKEFHYAKKLCGIVPTSTYLEQNYAPCCEGICTIGCCFFVCWADVITWLTEPTMNQDIKNMDVIYQKECSAYDKHQKKLSEIYILAHTKKHTQFVKTYKEYKYQILGIEEDDFNEL